VSLLFSLKNCVGYDLDKRTLRHKVSRIGEATFIDMTAIDMAKDHRTYGSMVIGATGQETTSRAAWTNVTRRSLDYLHLWNEFMLKGRLGHLAEFERSMDVPKKKWRGIEEGWRGALSTMVELQPGEEGEIVFLTAWFFPNQLAEHGVRVGHMYENWFQDAQDVASYGVENLERLREESRRFSENQYRGTLPSWLVSLLNAQLTPLTANSYWSRNGEFGLWEGGPGFGARMSIPSYWFPILLFFPDINRQALEQIGQSQRSDGWTPGWLGYNWERIICCIDFHAHFPLEVYRHYLWTGDSELLRELWPSVKAALDVLDRTDTNEDGLPDRAEAFVQVYDMWRLPGTQSYLCSLWMAALKAAVEMASALGEDETARRYQAILDRSTASFEKLFWNGEYYRLFQDLEEGVIHEGCMADQVRGQWYTKRLGLGPIHEEEHVRSALKAIFRYNRIPGERVLLNGSDPRGRVGNWSAYLRPDAYPYLRDQWVSPWTGTEFAVSSMLILEGFVDEGLQVARDVYDRYRENGLFWNHIEYGNHYSRPTDVWTILLALQGLKYNAGDRSLSFAPYRDADRFESIFALPGVWGRIRESSGQGHQREEVFVEAGEITLSTLRFKLVQRRAIDRLLVSHNGEEVACRMERIADEVLVRLDLPVRLSKSETLSVDMELIT
jgi:uncharacterized protein (DUF608 family)